MPGRSCPSGQHRAGTASAPPPGPFLKLTSGPSPSPAAAVSAASRAGPAACTPPAGGRWWWRWAGHRLPAWLANSDELCGGVGRQGERGEGETRPTIEVLPPSPAPTAPPPPPPPFFRFHTSSAMSAGPAGTTTTTTATTATTQPSPPPAPCPPADLALDPGIEAKVRRTERGAAAGRGDASARSRTPLTFSLVPPLPRQLIASGDRDRCVGGRGHVRVCERWVRAAW